MPSKENFPVLLVEDNKHDALFVQRAWKINRIANPLIVVPNGQACLDYLRHEGEYADKKKYPDPGFVMMDIRMPDMDGITCLEHIKSDPELKHVPVIMLTTSREDEDRLRSYRIGCSAFIQKPVDFNKLSEAIGAIYLYWSLCELP